MRYELYVDSLFAINFAMNFYLLLLVNHSTFRTATPGRLVMGAAFGGGCSLLPFLYTAPGFFKVIFGMLTGTVGMIMITFPVKGFRTFWNLLERLLIYSFCMGGGMLFLIRAFPSARGFLTSACGIAGAGGCLYLLLKRFRTKREVENSLCRAVLIRNGRKVQVNALMDSGNSLVEPVSGKPVSVVERDVFRELWGESIQGYRVIPYHSVGRARGIMDGYLLPELQLEIEGIQKIFRDVYIAVSPEPVSNSESAETESIKMIVNPGLLKGDERGKPPKRQNARTYDSESSHTGKNAV